MRRSRLIGGKCRPDLHPRVADWGERFSGIEHPLDRAPAAGALARAFDLELKEYWRLGMLARSKTAIPELAERAHSRLFRVRTILEGNLQRAISQAPVNPDARLGALFDGSFFGFSKKQGTSLRLPLRTCTPTKLCAGGCYAHDVLDATPAAVVRGAINGWIADRYEEGSHEVRAEIADRLVPHVKRAIKNAKGELINLPPGFERRAFIRFSHVGEIVHTPTFANDLARMVHELSEGDVDCVVYTRHKRVVELDPDLWVLNFTLDPASEDRRSWIPDYARIVYSAFGGKTSPDAEVNFLEHHRHGHLAQVGVGQTCPATRPDAKDRTCDGNQCNRCFVPKFAHATGHSLKIIQEPFIMNKSTQNQLLGPIYQKVSDLRAKIQHDGKRAFDRDDPSSARKEAGRLEQIDRAEVLLEELNKLLSDLGISEDTRSDKVVSEPETKRHKPNTARKGAKRLAERALHPPQLMEPVVDVLRELGGEAHLHDIWAGIERKLGSNFNASDLEMMKRQKSLRWQYNVCWTLTQLKNEGRVEHGEKRGIWRLTPST
jgi:hypothetical protein